MTGISALVGVTGELSPPPALLHVNTHREAGLAVPRSQPCSLQDCEKQAAAVKAAQSMAFCYSSLDCLRRW